MQRYILTLVLAIASLPIFASSLTDRADSAYQAGAYALPESALCPDPSNADARANLDYVNERIVDKKGNNGSFLSNTYDSLTARQSSDGWAWTALLLFALTTWPHAPTMP